MTTLNKIVLTPFPNGRQIEGILEGALKPGTIVEIKPSTEPVGGKHTFRAYTPGADGDRPVGALLVLLENLRGGDPTEAYVTGERCRVYIPLPGDELLMLVANISGTADAFAIGDKLIVDNSTGKLIATTGTPETEPFTVMETKTALAADTLVHVMYSGY